jgi:hypothetical protein
LRLLTPRKLRARRDDQACSTARPRHVRLHHAIHRFLAPARVLYVLIRKPFHQTLGTPRRIRGSPMSDHGSSVAIQNP